MLCQLSLWRHMAAIATWIHTVPESSVKTSNDLVYCVLIVHVFSVYTFDPIQWFCNARSADMACAYALQLAPHNVCAIRKLNNPMPLLYSMNMYLFEPTLSKPWWNAGNGKFFRLTRVQNFATSSVSKREVVVVVVVAESSSNGIFRIQILQHCMNLSNTFRNCIFLVM